MSHPYSYSQPFPRQTSFNPPNSPQDPPSAQPYPPMPTRNLLGDSEKSYRSSRSQPDPDEGADPTAPVQRYHPPQEGQYDPSAAPDYRAVESTFLPPRPIYVEDGKWSPGLAVATVSAPSSLIHPEYGLKRSRSEEDDELLEDSGDEDRADFTQTFYDPFRVKHRRRTSPAQLKILEHYFDINAKPDVGLRQSLSNRLDMTPREVQVWFQNRRAKIKKQEEKQEQKDQQSRRPRPRQPDHDRTGSMFNSSSGLQLQSTNPGPLVRRQSAPLTTLDNVVGSGLYEPYWDPSRQPTGLAWEVPRHYYPITGSAAEQSYDPYYRPSPNKGYPSPRSMNDLPSPSQSPHEYQPRDEYVRTDGVTIYGEDRRPFMPSSNNGRRISNGLTQWAPGKEDNGRVEQRSFSSIGNVMSATQHYAAAHSQSLDLLSPTDSFKSPQFGFRSVSALSTASGGGTSVGNDDGSPGSSSGSPAQENPDQHLGTSQQQQQQQPHQQSTHVYPIAPHSGPLEPDPRYGYPSFTEYTFGAPPRADTDQNGQISSFYAMQGIYTPIVSPVELLEDGHYNLGSRRASCPAELAQSFDHLGVGPTDMNGVAWAQGGMGGAASMNLQPNNPFGQQSRHRHSIAVPTSGGRTVYDVLSASAPASSRPPLISPQYSPFTSGPHNGFFPPTGSYPNTSSQQPVAHGERLGTISESSLSAPHYSTTTADNYEHYNDEAGEYITINGSSNPLIMSRSCQSGANVQHDGAFDRLQERFSSSAHHERAEFDHAPFTGTAQVEESC